MNELLRPQTTITLPEEHSLSIIHAGETANRAAANHLFADYHQRRAAKTIRTQTAALLLWVQYLAEAGAADELLVAAEAWATSFLDDRELADLLEYAQSQPSSLPNYIWGSLLPAFAQSLARGDLGVSRRLCEVVA